MTKTKMEVMNMDAIVNMDVQAPPCNLCGHTTKIEDGLYRCPDCDWWFEELSPEDFEEEWNEKPNRAYVDWWKATHKK